MKTLEIEQKFRIRNPHAIRRKLKRLRARKLKAGKERNEFFDWNGRLLKQRQVLRLRLAGLRSWLTLKGDRLPGARHTRRLEIETPVAYRPMKFMLIKMGFGKIFAYTKDREEYEAASCVVTLDYLRPFGWFLEIEGAPRRIDALAKKLGLTAGDRETASYLEMVGGAGKKRRGRF